MTNFKDNSDLAMLIAEINQKALLDVVNKQAGSFSELLNTGLGQLKSLQSAQTPQNFIDTQINYSQDVEKKMRTLISSNIDIVANAQKEVLELLSKQGKKGSK